MRSLVLLTLCGVLVCVQAVVLTMPDTLVFPGSGFPIQWSGAKGDVTLELMKANPGNLQTVAVIGRTLHSIYSRRICDQRVQQKVLVVKGPYGVYLQISHPTLTTLCGSAMAQTIITLRSSEFWKIGRRPANRTAQVV